MVGDENIRNSAVVIHLLREDNECLAHFGFAFPNLIFDPCFDNRSEDTANICMSSVDDPVRFPFAFLELRGECLEGLLKNSFSSISPNDVDAGLATVRPSIRFNHCLTHPVHPMQCRKNQTHCLLPLFPLFGYSRACPRRGGKLGCCLMTEAIRSLAALDIQPFRITEVESRQHRHTR